MCSGSEMIGTPCWVGYERWHQAWQSVWQGYHHVIEHLCILPQEFPSALSIAVIIWYLAWCWAGFGSGNWRHTLAVTQSRLLNYCRRHMWPLLITCHRLVIWHVFLACSRMREQGVQFTSRLWPCNSLSWLKAMGTATAQHIWCVHTTSGWCMYVNFCELLRE